MPVVSETIASGTTLDEALQQAEQIEAALADVPPGERLELRLELRPVVFAGVDWSELFVREAARAINAVDGLAQWVAQQVGSPLKPWPGQTDLAFGFVDDATGNWVLAIRWVTASAWFALVIRFLLQVAITIAAAAAVIWLADAVVRWSLRRLSEIPQQPGFPLLVIGALIWLATHRARFREAPTRD